MLPDYNNFEPEEIPESDFEPGEQPDRTFFLDTINKRIGGMVDGIEAKKQAIYMALKTEGMKYPIFSFDYGRIFEDLYGGERDYVLSEAKDRIEEAILADSRFKSIEFTSTETNHGEYRFSFTVTTVKGEKIKDEVSFNV